MNDFRTKIRGKISTKHETPTAYAGISLKYIKPGLIHLVYVHGSFFSLNTPDGDPLNLRKPFDPLHSIFRAP